MANDYRDDDRDLRRGNNNRGMFGYEGEGYMREDSDRGRDRFRSNAYGDFNRGDYNRPAGYGQSTGNDWGPQQRPSFRGRGPKNYQRADDRIREDVCERLMLDHDVDASDIEVKVEGGTVMLTGSVHDRNAKRLAEDIAESVLGVKDVQNEIRVIRADRGY